MASDHSHRFLRDFVDAVALLLGLDKFSDHVSTIAVSFTFFLFLHTVLAPAISARLFPVAFGNASRKAQNNWCVAAQLPLWGSRALPVGIK